MIDTPMTDDELIGYCQIHCETPRALFHADHVNRMLVLAGREPQDLEGFYSLHEEMEELCKLARERLNVPK